MVKFGVSVPTPDASARAPFDRCYEWCERAEALGFDYAVVPHHRFTPGYEASPWVALAALAARTSRIRLGTGVFILPLDHPLDVAEEVATLDVISGGRAFLGAGLGYRRYEWDALGLPYERRASRMEECLAVVQAAWERESFSFHGAHFDFDDIAVLPRPFQRPRPPIWLGANSGAAVARASRLADGWLVGFGDRLDALAPRVDAFRHASQEAGRRGEVSLLRLVGLCKTAAIELGPYNIRVNTVHPWGVDTPMGHDETIHTLFERFPTYAASFGSILAEPQIADPRDIADAVLWLASDESRLLTGAQIPLDMGATKV